MRRQRQTARSRRIRLEGLEQRQLLAATPLGVTPLDTGEFLLGTVAVTPVFFESNGEIDPETQNWTPEEIDEVLAKVSDGVNWWSETLDTLQTVHSLEFVIDDTYALNPVETPYEPIDRSSTAFNQYIGDFITAQGYGDVASIEEGVQRFNVAQRTELGTDWAFTIFVIDSSDDPDGLFAAGGSFNGAFAFAGGLFFITPSTRPVSTYTHEMGHIFWARDEYPGGGSYTDQRGYYNTQNLNAADNPAPGFQQEISIMRGGVPLNAAFDAHVSPASTFAMVGWQDSDGDGVFDLADVPLRLDAAGTFDAATSIYHFSGDASAVPLINRNSSGPQSDITLNRISQLQYSLDHGPWVVAAEPDHPQVEFDLSLPITQPFSTIRWRVIDQMTGIASPIIEGTSTLPAYSASSVSGLAFIDKNFDGLRDGAESALAMTEIIVRAEDGSSLFVGQVDAADFPEGQIGETPGVSIRADGITFDPQIGSFASAGAGDQPVFHVFDQQRDRWIDRWSSKVVLEANFAQGVGDVRIDAFGLGDASFARLEAYDAGGLLIGRATSESIGDGESVTVHVTDSLGRIASVRAFGHAGTSVALNKLRFGSAGVVVTDSSGGWQVKNLADGNYIVDLVPERLIHRFDQSTVAIEVVSGLSEPILAAARRVTSPRHNAALAEDASKDGNVTSRDALLIINDLDRFAPRVLQPSEVNGFDIDVNNDGAVSALDALLVINFLMREDRGEGENSQNNWARSADLALDSPPTELFDSADGTSSSGGKTPDESEDQRDADRTDQPMLGSPALASKICDFGPFSTPIDPEPTDRDEPNPFLDEQSTDLNPPEISEPLERSAI